MKNLYKILNYSLAATLLFFAACESPLQDEIDEIKESTAIVKDVEYTLTDDDYETIDDECDCTGFGSFNSDDDAKAYIPVALNDVFPALGTGSSSITTYLRFNGSSPDLNGTQTTFTVPSTDYDLFHDDPDGFDNFGNADEEVVEYVNWKGFEGEDGDYLDITFDYYDGTFHAGAVSRIVYTVAYGWQYAWIAPQEVYDFFGESSTEYPDGSGTYTPDFSYEDEAEEVMHIYLNEYKSVFAEDGDILVVQYNYDNGADNEVENPTEMAVLMYIYNGSEWIEYGDGYQTTEQVLSFANDGKNWVPDNTIKYTLGSSDYSAIAADWATENPDGSTSVASYSNFDLTLWTDDQINSAINQQMLASSTFLKEDGQKYAITYAVWMPGAGTVTKLFVYDGTNYVLVEAE